MLETILLFPNKTIYVSNILNHLSEWKQMINTKENYSF